MLDELFKFPIILIDEEEEEKRKKDADLEGTPYEAEAIYSFTEQPYFKFESIIYKWLPTQESKDKAREGIFEASIVDFGDSRFLVPMTKDEFKKKFKTFCDKMEKKEQPLPERSMLLTFESDEQLLEFKKTLEKMMKQ